MSSLVMAMTTMRRLLLQQAREYVASTSRYMMKNGKEPVQ